MRYLEQILYGAICLIFVGLLILAVAFPQADTYVDRACAGEPSCAQTSFEIRYCDYHPQYYIEGTIYNCEAPKEYYRAE